MSTQPKLTLLAIRHGETVLNLAKRYQGHSDSPLTETGRNQVASLGRRLAKFDFDALISSDLGRARETAAIIAECTGHSVKTDSRLRERNYGVLEGLTVPEIKAGHSDVLKRLDANDPDYAIPEGESHRQHYQRNVAVFEELQSGISDGRVALVVHGGVLDSLFRYVARLPLNQPRCFIIPNASLTMVTHGIFYGTQRWVIETWGDTGHLEGIGQHLGLG
ncbi:MAG: histidine phosphatase family protein [Desulfobacteraceae bacterium]|jgi:probable phosphoglycerate mutase|nr:histidine phosphatase family protein [Desulfobacteraceae bacterium]